MLVVDGVAGTVLVVRKVGFLCVFSESSTLRRPEVTPSPLLRDAKIESMLGAGEVAVRADGAGAGGDMGGGMEDFIVDA